MKVAIYPGTFDPITLGHVDIVQRTARLFDHLVVAVAASAGKNPQFELSDRFAMCEETFADLPTVSVESFDGLLVDFAKAKKANIILRGIRGASDIEYEFQLAAMNQKMQPECETLFVKASDRTSLISSSIVREIAAMGGDVSLFVPLSVQKRLTT